MKMKKILTVLILIFPITTFSQVDEQLERIIQENSKISIGDVNIKVVDLDNDLDNDYILYFQHGESKHIIVYLNVNNKLEKKVDEFGFLSFDVENSNDLKASSIIVKSKLWFCCGESPFVSFRSFKFANDSIFLIDNYVIYNDIYCKDSSYNIIKEPYKLINEPYFVEINIDNYNVRFSADLSNHNASFVCLDNTNIISQLKKGSIVKVIGEYEGKDKSERTWLYVEIDAQSINSDFCNFPLKYGFEDQKLRAWISNKYVQNCHD